jgi:methionyl-tRNA formyltransferase
MPVRRLKVHVITEDDPLYVVRFFEVIVGVTVSRAFHEPLHRTALRIRRFYGSVDFVRLLARWGRAKLSGVSIGSLAQRAGLPVVPAASVNDPGFVRSIADAGVDVIVSVAAPEVFRAPLLAAPRLGCINIHSGRLPQYRGMMPTFWQMLEGKPFVTVTVHEMVAKLDAGGVVDTLEFPLEERDSLDRVISGTKQGGARLMIRVLERIAQARAMPEATPLDMSKARLFKFPQPADVAKFRARGHRML